MLWYFSKSKKSKRRSRKNWIYEKSEKNREKCSPHAYSTLCWLLLTTFFFSVLLHLVVTFSSQCFFPLPIRTYNAKAQSAQKHKRYSLFSICNRFRLIFLYKNFHWAHSRLSQLKKNSKTNRCFMHDGQSLVRVN